MLRALIVKIFNRANDYGNERFVSRLPAELIEGRTLVWGNNAGYEIWQDDEGIRRHYDKGEVVAYQFGRDGRHVVNRVSPDPDCVDWKKWQTAQTWFAEGAKSGARKPVLLDRYENSQDPDPKTGCYGGSEWWFHPEHGRVSVHFTMGPDGRELRSDAEPWMADARAEAQAQAKGYLSASQMEYLQGLEARGATLRLEAEATRSGGEVDLNELRRKVLGKDPDGRPNPTKEEKSSGATVPAPDLKKMREQLRYRLKGGLDAPVEEASIDLGPEEPATYGRLGFLWHLDR
jgi:hypothetical protein